MGNTLKVPICQSRGSGQARIMYTHFVAYRVRCVIGREVTWHGTSISLPAETTRDKDLAMSRRFSTYDLEGLPHLPLNLKSISINGVRTLMLPCVSLIGRSERPSGPPRDKVPKAKTSHPDYQAMSSPRGRELAHDYQPHASVTLTTWLRFYL